MENNMWLSDNAYTVLKERYLARDEKGNVYENPNMLFQRVAVDIAKADIKYQKDEKALQETEDKFYKVMTSLKFLPNSPTLFNAGREFQQLSACFVLPIEDNMEGIFKTLYNMAMIQRSGGGTGFSFSRLRPKGDVVGSTAGTTSGPISFMEAYDAVTQTISQGGHRRGANMGIMRVDHPDIEEFIMCKDKEGSISNFNISVAITDVFMELVKREGTNIMGLINPRTNHVAKEINVKDIWRMIVNQSWKNGEPGIWFIDKTNEMNPTPELGDIESTNPCGEQPLLPYESCNLGSINLAKFVIPKICDEGPKPKVIDWDDLKETVHIATHFLDNVIDRNKYVMKEIEEITKGNRKIGLGIMGWHDMLVQLGIPYDSNEALDLASRIMSFINKEALQASRELAIVRGPFPNWKKSCFKDDKNPPRNATRTTIAPTGTIAIIADCSSGIEPYFSLAYERKMAEGNILLVKNKYLDQMANEVNTTIDWGLILQNRGTMKNYPPGFNKQVFKTSLEIDPSWHIKMQAIFQKHVDNAVSKTINLPNSATIEDVAKCFMMAYEVGCKGLTIYRDGSRKEQVLTIKQPTERPPVLKGETIKVKTGCGSLYVTINEMGGKPIEVFASIGKAGGCATCNMDALCRTVSIALRANVDIESIVKQLRNMRCPRPLILGGNMVLSCPDAVGQALEQYLKKIIPIQEYSGNCPSCGGVMIYEEGCEKCASCNYVRCG